MNTTSATARLVAIVNMIASDNDHESANAAVMLRRMAATAKKPVADMLRDAIGGKASGPDFAGAELEAARRGIARALERARGDAETIQRLQREAASMRTAHETMRTAHDEATRLAFAASTRESAALERLGASENRERAKDAEIVALRAALAQHRAPPVQPEPAPVERNRYTAAYNHPNAATLTGGDRDFLRGNLGKDRISPAQERWLSDIERRLSGEAVPRPARAAPAPQQPPRPAPASPDTYQERARATAQANVDLSGACPF